MQKIITYDTLRFFAYSNDKICKKPIRGIVISFSGLGCMDRFDEDTKEGIRYGEQGILYLYPYNNPWAWMNRQAVAYTEELLDILMEQYHLPDSVPIVSSGGSMGGQSALIFTRYAGRTPIACVTNCPVCDMVFHYTERADLPRTIYSALFHEEGTLEEALKRISPLHMAEQMPDIDYHFFHCEADKAVNFHSHSEKFVEELRRLGRRVTFDPVPGRGHCDLPEKTWEKYHNYCIDAVITK